METYEKMSNTFSSMLDSLLNFGELLFPLKKEFFDGFKSELLRKYEVAGICFDEIRYRNDESYKEEGNEILEYLNSLKSKYDGFLKYEKEAFPLFDKYASLSPEERDHLPIDGEVKDILNSLVLLRENFNCLDDLCLREQGRLLSEKCSDISYKLEYCPAVYPETRERVWNRPPYTVTDVRFSTPPYAGGLPLSECPGWENGGADWGHVDSISIQDGTGVLRTFSGEEIDSENRIVFEWKDFQVKYGIETGRVEFSPRLKQTVTLPSVGLEDAIREYISSPGDEVSRRMFRMALDGTEGLSSERKIELFADAEVRRQEISTGKTESHKLSRGL